MMKNSLYYLGVLVLIYSCSAPSETAQTSAVAPDTLPTTVEAPPLPSPLEQQMIDQGLVNVQALDATIRVDLRYSTTNNFVGVDVYGDLENAYLQPEPAQMLAQANTYLKQQHPDYALYIFDAARPRQVQQILWDTLDYPAAEKPKYVADPQKGSIHNYGAAVDLTIAGPAGEPLDMGTHYDYFGVLAYPTQEAAMLAQGKLTQAQVDNRTLLRTVMGQAGFSPIKTEWWHFNAFSRAEADRRYGMVE